MAKHNSHVIALLFMVAMSSIIVVGGYNILLGAYYGSEANNLPPPWKWRSGLSTTSPFINDLTINYIVVGDNAIPGLEDYILPVMKSLQDLLNRHYLGQVKITTMVGLTALGVQTPPSTGVFDPNIFESMRGILHFLRGQGSPLMLSLYPYQAYAYSGYTNNITLGYATFTSQTEQNSSIRIDGDLTYNIFDEMVDAFYAAIDKANVGNVAIAIGETGWPTNGNYAANPSLALTYNKKFKNHITSGKGTPMKPNIYIEGFIRSLFNENEKPEGESRFYGMFNVDSTRPSHSNVFD
ncbi:putative glucan endo-1,3-beta-glucosidase BG4 [Cucumis melo var. makuwa]|uniref:glucan endo-1,3-beta-D-glucosidase n=1 Tax=Cucumis melo var. makuwa TaxID=1194695 RepID=A0A5D3CFP7_CUCMM|nr:putative glucan endo-1,3-beta-glucosidase BG4 [Cucumis melo var. makuwa]